MRQRLDALGLGDQVQVVSAGVWASEGREVSRTSSAVLAGRGVDISAHRSQPVTTALLDQVNLVLVMEEAHRRSIFNYSPKYLAKTFLLTEMSGQHDDIEDPYGRAVEAYEATADQIAGLIDTGLPRILQRLKIEPPVR